MSRPSALLPGRRGIHLTRGERKQELTDDPCIKAFDADRAVCALCERVVTLRGRFYMDVWDLHRKNCLERRIAYLDINGLEIRDTMLSADPLVRKYDTTRVLCRTCNRWISILTSVDQWTQHRNACMDLNMSSEDQAQLHWGIPSWQRRTAEERKNILVADRLIEKVEPYRVRCRLCQKWVCLRNNCQYFLLPWRQHRKVKHNLPVVDIDIQPTSLWVGDSGVGRGIYGSNTDLPSPHTGAVYPYYNPDNPVARRILHIRSCQQFLLQTTYSSPENELNIDTLVDFLNADGTQEHRWQEFGAVEVVTAMDSHISAALTRLPGINSINLDEPAGRLSYIRTLVEFLLRTAYFPDGDLTIAALVNFLDASVPEHRWQGFDTLEVVRVIGKILRSDELRLVLEGDVVRLTCL